MVIDFRQFSRLLHTKESELLLKVKRDYIAVCRVQNHYRETENWEQTGWPRSMLSGAAGEGGAPKLPWKMSPGGNEPQAWDITSHLHGLLLFTGCVHMQSKLIFKISVSYSHFMDEKLKFIVFKGHIFKISGCLLQYSLLTLVKTVNDKLWMITSKYGCFQSPCSNYAF